MPPLDDAGSMPYASAQAPPASPAESGRDVECDKRAVRSPVPSPLDKARGHEIDWPVVAPMFQAVRGLHTGFVYVIAEDENGPVKIGTSRDPIARIRSMTTGNHRPLKIIHVLVGGRATESMLHRRWASFRLVGEWFDGDCRSTLGPILRRAATLQADMFPGDPSEDDLLAAIIEAHDETAPALIDTPRASTLGAEPVGPSDLKVIGLTARLRHAEHRDLAVTNLP